MRLRHFGPTGSVTGIAVLLLGLVGCAAERPKLVPDSAALKAQGNDRIVYVAQDSGNVWVADKGANAIVYSGRLNAGDRLVLDTHENVVSVNDRAVMTRELPRRDYQVYFDPGLAVPAAARVPADARADLARPVAVPAVATLVGEGRERIEYTAADDGELWVTNGSRDKLVYAGRVVRGEDVIVDPKENRLSIGSRTVLANGAKLPSDNYRIFFARRTDLPAETVLAPTPGAVTVAPVVVIDRPSVVPATAIVRSEFDARTDVVAIDPGTAWVVNASNGVVYSTRLQKGDTLTVDPAASQISLNGNRAFEGPLAAGRYRVFFAKGIP